MTKLILIRPGHVRGISPERFRGRAELPLTELGRREAELTAARIAASWQPAAIYTSPVGRAVGLGDAGPQRHRLRRLAGADQRRGACPLAGRARHLAPSSGLGGAPAWR